MNNSRRGARVDAPTLMRLVADVRVRAEICPMRFQLVKIWGHEQSGPSFQHLQSRKLSPANGNRTTPCSIQKLFSVEGTTWSLTRSRVSAAPKSRPLCRCPASDKTTHQSDPQWKQLGGEDVIDTPASGGAGDYFAS